MTKKYEVSLIGCGSLATTFANKLHDFLPQWKIKNVLGRNLEKLDIFCRSFGCEGTTDIEKFIPTAAPIVVEFAGGSAVCQYANKVLSSKRDFVAVSIGALIDPNLLATLEQSAQQQGVHLYVPNGAIGGLDFLQTTIFQAGGMREVCIKTTKTPSSLKGAPGLSKLDPMSIKEATEVFNGPVEEAIVNFPKNVNVAVATKLASSCPQIKVKIVADPKAKGNMHEISTHSELVDAHLNFCCKPDPSNPGSSTTAAMSVLGLLKNLVNPVVYF